MAIGRVNTGGGSGKLYAVIAVTYPDGSVCTCYNGTKTLKAKDTSGKALFNVSVGEWTVTATDGSRTKSASVSITADGQIESVTLKYELVLYKDGDQFTDVTGGWTTYNPAPAGSDIGSVGYREDGIEMWCDGSKRYVYVAARTTKMIDLTDFNTLQFTSVNSYGHIRSVRVEKGTSESAAATLSIDGTGDKTVDISAVGGEYYVVFICMNQEYIDTGLKVNNVLLK